MSFSLFIVCFNHVYNRIVAGYHSSSLCNLRVMCTLLKWKKCPHLRETTEKEGRHRKIRAMLLPEMVTTIFFIYGFLVKLGSDAQQRGAVIEGAE